MNVPNISILMRTHLYNVRDTMHKIQTDIISPTNLKIYIINQRDSGLSTIWSMRRN